MVALTMDSSNRVAYVLGEKDIRVHAPGTTPEEWLDIFKGIMLFAKPHLKYLPCFKPFVELAKEGNPKFRPVTVSSYGSTWQRIKCVHLYYLSTISGKEGVGPIEDPVYSNVPRVVSVESILLSNKGEFLLWNAEYEARVSGDPESGHCLTFSLSNKLRTLSEEEILEYLNSHHDFPEKFIKKIFRESYVACEDMKKRLEGAENLRDELGKSLQRIEWAEK